MSLSTALSSTPLLHTHPKLPSPSIHNLPLSSPFHSLSTLRFRTHGSLRHCFDSLLLKRKEKRLFGVWAVATANGGEAERKGGVELKVEEEEEKERWSESTLPDRFRPLTRPVPVPPVLWPWFLVGGVIAVLFAYSWRVVLWELKNWQNSLKFIVRSTPELLKFVGSFFYYYFGDVIETSLSAIWSIYSGIVSSAPVPELTTIILLASIVLSISGAAVPDSVNSQPTLLTFSGIIGYAAVRGFISEPFFWTLLLGIFLFARFLKKRDYVSSALPVAAVLASVGETWIRAVALISFTGLAIGYHSKHPVKGKEEAEKVMKTRKLPLPLVGVALAVAIRVAAQWAGYRHLTWMIV
ncbi:hypothetical protein Drorol1_Dr00002681 [Drosera rotundifolia]